MATKYPPYNDYEKILGYKADWHTAKNSGQDPSQYYQAAMPYYQSLIANGYSDLATELANSDHAQAGTLRDKYGLKADNQFNLDNDFAAMTGQAATPNASNNPQTSQDIINAAHPNDASINKLMDMGTGVSGMANDVFNTANGIATGSIPVQPSAATQDLYDLYKDDYNRLNGQIKYDANGNVISGLNTEHYNIGRNQLDYLNNFDITKQPYYQGIMDQYKLGGYNAAQGEYANGAANNSGNIDSYAAANANRQQLAFTTAGMQQAMAMANQNQQNWQNLYSQMSNDLYNQGTLSLATLGVARDMYAQDSQERMNALDVEGSLASAQMAASVQQVLSLVEERKNDKGITAEMAMQEKDIAAAKEQLELQLASNERIQEGINALGYYQTDANERMSQDSNATQRYGYDTNRDIAGINANAQLGVAGINRDAQLGVAGINANASMSNAALQAELQKYLGDLGYGQTMAGYQNALDLATLNNMSAKELQELVNKGNLDVANAKLLYDTSGGGGTPIDAVNDPDTVAQAIYDAVSQGKTDEMTQLNLDQIHSVQEFRNLLVAPVVLGGFGLDLSDANKVIKLLKDSGLGDNELYAMLNHYFPGVMTNTSWGNAQNSNTTSVVQ